MSEEDTEPERTVEPDESVNEVMMPGDTVVTVELSKALISQGLVFTYPARADSVADGDKLEVFIENTTTNDRKRDYMLSTAFSINSTRQADVDVSENATENTEGPSVIPRNARIGAGKSFPGKLVVSKPSDSGSYSHGLKHDEAFIGSTRTSAESAAQTIAPISMKLEPGQNVLLTLTNISGQPATRMSASGVIILSDGRMEDIPAFT